MFGHRYFGARYFAPRYFGDGGAAVVVPPVAEGGGGAGGDATRGFGLPVGLRHRRPATRLPYWVGLRWTPRLADLGLSCRLAVQAAEPTPTGRVLVARRPVVPDTPPPPLVVLPTRAGLPRSPRPQPQPVVAFRWRPMLAGFPWATALTWDDGAADVREALEALAVVDAALRSLWQSRALDLLRKEQ